MTRIKLLFGIALLLLSSPLYADGGTTIAACITALPSTGGVCDFRNQNAQSAASTITVNKPVTLLLDGTQLTVKGSPGISIQANGVSIRGTKGQSMLIQGTAGRDIIGGSTLTDLEIQGLTFTGITCSAPLALNNGISLSGGIPGAVSRVRIEGNVFTGLCWYGVRIQNASDVVIADNVIYASSLGILFSGVVRGKILHNVIRDTQLANTIFTTAMDLDSTNSGFAICSDIQVSNNTVQNFVDAQGLLVHAGTHLTISGNIFDNVLIGISANTFTVNDTLSDVTITGNVYVGTTTTGAAAGTGNYGIFVGGSSTNYNPRYVVIANNTISSANEIALASAQGGIGLGWVNNVIVEGNFVHDTVASGIVLNNPNTQVQIIGNYINNLTNGTTNGIYGAVGGGAQSGRVRSNFVTTATNGYNFAVNSPGLLFGSNDSTFVTTALQNPGNVTQTP